MEIRRLSYFVRIVEDRSLTRASAVLGIAQPALSRQVRLLEEELGVSLFNRTARGMIPTEEGEQLRASVAGPLRELELALQNIRSSTRLEGNYAIGMSTNIAQRLAGPLAVRLSSSLAHIKLRIVEGPTGGLIEWINRGLIDIALLEHAPLDERLFDRELLSEELMLVGRPDADLPDGRAMPFREVAALPLIIPSHHLGIRNTINQAGAKSRSIPNVCFEADSAKLALDLVEEGMGYAILPQLFVPEGRFRLWPIVEPVLPFTLSFCLRRNMDNGSQGRVTVVGHVVDAVTGLLGVAPAMV